MAASTEIVEGRMPVNLSFFHERSISPVSSISSASTKYRGHKVEYSHKLTEKRRRDRMNISMSEIAQLLPSSSESKQLEKAEILEKTIIYIKKLQEITGKQELNLDSKNDNPQLAENQEVTTTDGQVTNSQQSEVTSNYKSGFRDCIKEVFHCLTNVEAMDLQQPCFQRLMGHLQGELQFMSGNAEKGNTNHSNDLGNQQSKSLNALSNGGTDSISSSNSLHPWQCKRSYEKINNTAIQQGNSRSENCPSKRPHMDDSSDINGGSALCTSGSENNLSSLHPWGSDNKLSSLCLQESESSSSSPPVQRSNNSKEKPKFIVGMGNVWSANGLSFSRTESCGAENEKEAPCNGNIFERSNLGGSKCGNEDASGNHKWLNSGPEVPVVATPISPRTPYLPNPYTASTYALHPSGTHYIPVVLHLNTPLPVVPPFPEVNARVNSSLNGYMAAMNSVRMAGLQYPYFPCMMPFVSGSLTGMNGIRNPACKQEPETQKYDSKPKDVDSSTNCDESM